MENTHSTALYLEAPAPALSPAPPGDGPGRSRSFSGIAYSGDAINYFDSPLVIDLASLVVPAPCPVLLQHERDKRIGVCALTVADGALLSQGRLLANADALALAADADDGFPWQLSVHAEPGSVEYIQPGGTAEVNGRPFSGPLAVYRHTRIRELSFTPTGVDHRTVAHVLSATPPTEDPPMPDPIVSPPAADLTATVADLTTQLAAAVTRADAAESALAESRKATRLSAVTTAFAQLGRTISEAEATIYLSLPDTAWEQVAKDLAASKPAAPASLFSEQATGDPNSPPPPTLSLSAIYAARREVTQ